MGLLAYCPHRILRVFESREISLRNDPCLCGQERQFLPTNRTQLVIQGRTQMSRDL